MDFSRLALMSPLSVSPMNSPNNSFRINNNNNSIRSLPSNNSARSLSLNGSLRNLSPEVSFRKRSRFFPQENVFENSDHSLSLWDVDEHDNDNEHNDRDDDENDSVSINSGSHDSMDSTQRQDIMMDTSENSINLDQLLEDMEEERKEKNTNKAMLKEMEDKDLADVSVSDSDDSSYPSIDSAERQEKQVRSSMMFACLSVIGMGFLAKALGKMQNLFNRTRSSDAPNDLAAEAADEAQQEVIDRAAQMALIQSQNSSGSSLIAAGPIPVPGGAESQ